MSSSSRWWTPGVTRWPTTPTCLPVLKRKACEIGADAVVITSDKSQHEGDQIVGWDDKVRFHRCQQKCQRLAAHARPHRRRGRPRRPLPERRGDRVHQGRPGHQSDRRPVQREKHGVFSAMVRRVVADERFVSPRPPSPYARRRRAPRASANARGRAAAAAGFAGGSSRFFFTSSRAWVLSSYSAPRPCL